VNLMRVQSSVIGSLEDMIKLPSPMLLIQILRVAATLVQTAFKAQRTLPSEKT
jgi:hypothetical protein